jgi:hypothetical protein
MKDKKISIEFSWEDVKYMYHTWGRSFYHQFGGSERFSCMSGSDKDVEKVFPSDDIGSMYSTNTYTEALLLCKVLNGIGYTSVILSDEYIVQEDGSICDPDYIILTTKDFMVD